MRLFYALVSLLFINLGFGQEYKFDRLIINTHSSSVSKETERSNMYNSKDFSYHMHFYYQNDSLKSNILDTKNNTAHYFHIDKKDSLIFLKTENFEMEDKTYSYTFSDVKTKRNGKEIKLKIKNHTDRKITRYKLIIKKTDENYFPFFQFNGMMETFYFLELNTPLNFMVLEAEGYYTGGGFARYKLKSVEEIDLLVQVPQ